MDKFMYWGFAVTGIAALPLGFLSWRNGSLLQAASSSEAIFRRRRTTCVFALCAYLLLAVFTPYIDCRALQDQAQAHANLLQRDVAIAQNTTLAIVAVVAGVGLWLLRFCFPEELRLNLDKCTYRLTKGWPAFGWTYSGTWDDIGGIYIKDITRARLVCLSFNHPVGRWTLLGIAGRNSEAVSLARELAARLSLPLINPPNG